MQINFDDIFRRDQMTPDGNNPMYRIMLFLTSLMRFCFWTASITFVLLLFVTDLLWKGELMGICGVCLIIGCGIFSFVWSLIPDDVKEEAFRQWKEQLEERNKQLKEKKDDDEEDGK